MAGFEEEAKLLKEENDKRKQWAIDRAGAISPELAVEAKKISQRSDYAADFLLRENNINKVKQTEKINAINFGDLSRTKFYDDPVNAAIADGDTDKLLSLQQNHSTNPMDQLHNGMLKLDVLGSAITSTLDHSLDWVYQKALKPKDARGDYLEQTAKWRAEQNLKLRSEEEIQTAKNEYEVVKKNRKDNPVVTQPSSTTSVSDTGLLRSAKNLENAPSDKRMAVMGQLANQSYGDALWYTAKNPGLVVNYLLTEVPTLVMTAPIGGAAGGIIAQPVKNVAVKRAIVGATTNFTVAYPQSTAGNIPETLRKHNGDVGKALGESHIKGLAEGSVNAAFGGIPLPFAGAGVAQKLGNVGARGTFDAIGGAGGAASASLVVGEKIDRGELFSETIFGFASAPVDVAIITAETGGAAVRTKVNSVHLDRDIELSGQSKTRERDPETFLEFAKETMPDQNVYVPASKFSELFQSDEALTVADKVIDGKRDALLQAVATDGDVVISRANYITYLQEHHASLKDDIRVDLGSMSNREADSVFQAIENGSLVKDIVADNDKKIINRESSKKVYDDIYGQLFSLRRDTNVAEREATLITKGFITLAERSGIDPFELYSGYNLNINRPLPEVLTNRKTIDNMDILLDRLRENDVPTDSEVYGQGITEFLREFGIVDENGEFSGRDLDVDLQPGQKRLIRDGGITLENAIEKARESGYFDSDSIGVNDLIDAILKDTQGEAVSSGQNLDSSALDTQSTLNELSSYLSDKGIDLANTDNATIKNMLFGIERQPRNISTRITVDGKTFNQEFKAYHGTNSKITNVDKYGAFNSFLFFSEDKDAASSHGENVYSIKMDDEDIIKASQIPYMDNATDALPVINHVMNYLGVDEEVAWELISEETQVHELDLELEDLGEASWFVQTQTAEAAKALGYKGVFVRDEHGTSIMYDMFDMEINLSLNQNVENTGSPKNVLFQNESSPRGRIRIGDDNKINIDLFENANLSTVLHEVGHMYLKLLSDVAAMEKSPAQIKDDLGTILNWLGAENVDGITTEQHEQFARGFEAYLMEGKAPSIELRSAFARFKSWLAQIYKTLSALNVKLNDDVRVVFDRILASDEEIESVKAMDKFSPLFATAKDANMSDAEFNVYRKEAEKASIEAKERLENEIKKESERELKDWYKNAKEEVRKTVEAEVNDLPVYNALNFLQRGTFLNEQSMPEGIEKFKLDKQSLVEKYGKSFLNKLPRPYIYSKEGGVHIDEAAEILGFGSGDEMVQAILSVPNRKEYIKAETDTRMIHEYGDMVVDGSITEAAITAVHNDAQAKVLHAELRSIEKQKAKVDKVVRSREKEIGKERRAMFDNLPPAAVFREVAKSVISESTVGNIQPHLYLNAERKASKESFEAASKRNFEAAFEAKQRELMSHYLYREAVRTKDEIDSMVRYMKRFEKRSVREKLGLAGFDYLEQIDALSSQYEFNKNVSLKEIERRQSLLAFVEQQKDEGNNVVVPESVLMNAEQVSYKTLQVEELAGLVDAVKNIEHLANLKNKLLGKHAQKSFDAAKEELIAAAVENEKLKKRSPVDPALRSKKDKLLGWAALADASLLKVERVIDWLDGNDVAGPWNQYVFRPLAESQHAENDLTVIITNKLAENFESVQKNRGKAMQDKFFIPGTGQTFSRQGLIAVALNMGNESNFDKMMRGHEWDVEMINTMISHLTEQDWQFIQRTWDIINELWEPIAALEKRLSGLVPEKVESREFTVNTADGKAVEIKGGYYPLVYDANMGQVGQKQAMGDASSLFEEGFAYASTSKGHTKERSGYAAPLNLDLNVIPTHVSKVIHDITHREALMSAQKIVNDRDIRATLQDRVGEQQADMFMPWLRRIANDRSFGNEQGLGFWNKLISTGRTNATVVAMGFKVTTAASQLAGMAQSLDMVKPSYLIRGIGDALIHPFETLRWVQEQSGEMRHRFNMLDRDVRDGLRKMVGKNDVISQVKRFAFHGISFMDAVVTAPTWKAAYQQSIDSGMTHDNAVAHADKVIRLTQGAGGAKDLSAIQSNNEMTKALTMFYSYFNVLYNIQRDMSHQASSEGKAAFPKILARSIVSVVIPAVLGELLAGRTPDEDEDLAKWVAVKTAAYPFMSVPVLRDIVSSAESGFGYQPTPLAGAGKSIVGLLNSVVKYVDDESDTTEADVMANALDASGYIFGLPTGQAKITGGYLWDIMKGDEKPDGVLELMRNLAYRRKKE